MTEQNIQQFEKLINYPGYQINRLGLIKNIKGQLMTQNIGKLGYVRISLEGKNQYTHRLVAKQFIEKPNDYYCVVLHKNGDRKNNSVDNLIWQPKIRCRTFYPKDQNQSIPYHKGVQIVKKTRNLPEDQQKWQAVLYAFGVQKQIGTFKTRDEAIEKYNQEIKKVYGDQIITVFQKIKQNQEKQNNQ